MLLLVTTAVMPYLAVFAPESIDAELYTPGYCDCKSFSLARAPVVMSHQATNLDVYDKSMCMAFMATRKDQGVVVLPGQDVLFGWWMVMINHACLLLCLPMCVVVFMVSY